MVELLAEGPRSVGELAELTGLRQPQTTKHLQTLARAGLVAVFPLGQRRVYALEGMALQSFERRLHELVETTAAHAGARDVLTRYQAAIETETAVADRDRWADGRTFVFDRELPASPDVVWQHWVDPALLATWWAPPSFTVSRCALVPRRGGRALLEYQDADGHTYLSEGRVRAAKKPEHLEFDLSVLDDAGAVMLTGHYDVQSRRDARRHSAAPRPEHHRHHGRGGPRHRRHRGRVGTGPRPARHRRQHATTCFTSYQARSLEEDRPKGSSIMTNPSGRLVRANISISLDGRYNGPGGPADIGAIVPYMTTDVARGQLGRIHDGATTAVLGRGSAEGFLGWWGQVAEDENADPRDRGYARWLVGTDKVVFSTTLTEAPWERTRIANAPVADVVAELKTTGEGDILANTSPSIVKPLLAADLVDRLYLMVTPEIAGDGQRLFDDGLPGSRWTLTHQETGDLGEMALVYDRTR